MATWTASYASWVTMRVVATETSVDVANNRSQVKVEVWLDSTSTTRVWNYDSQSVTATIDGTAMPANSYTYELYNRGSVRILNVSRWVPHNSDGTKTARIQVSASGGGQGASIDQNLTLTTIPRASSISSISGGALGSPVTVNISRASSSFTHKVIYRRTDGVNVTIENSAETSATFTPALSDAALIPNATSGTATMIVETYSGSTRIGTASKTFTVTVPASVVPTVSTRLFEEAVTAIKNHFGFFVQNQSKIKFTIGGTGAQGSAIRSYRTVVNGQTFTGTSGTTDILRTSGTNTITMEVTDSRGRKGTWSDTFSVVAYAQPVIESFRVVRALEDGTEEPDEGEFGKMAYRIRYTSYQQSPSIDRNPITVTWRHKRSDESIWSETSQVYHNNNLLVGGILIPDMDVDFSYDYEMLVSDFFADVPAKDKLPTGFTTTGYAAGGRGISHGRSYDKSVGGMLQVYGGAFLDGSRILTEADTKSGTNENGSWLKYPDGIQICYGKAIFDHTSQDCYVILPAAFMNTDFAITFNAGNGNWNTIEDMMKIGAGPSNAGGIRFRRPGTFAFISESGIPIMYMAIGRWK